MKPETKALIFSIAISLIITGLMVALNQHTPLPYDPSDKWMLLKNFVKYMIG